MILPLPLQGQVTDYGDVLFVQQLLVKGRRRRLIFHIGRTADTTEADRVVNGSATTSAGKVDHIMDLKADQQVPLSLGWTDELGHPVPGPDGATVAYSVDDPAIINLTDNGDGTANAAAVGDLGSATVHVEVTADGLVLTGDLLINVVAGDAERVEIVAGEATEVTPDV